MRLFLVAMLIAVFAVVGCMREIHKFGHGERWERVLADENKFRRLSAQKLGCTEEEIEEQLPDLTVDKVYDKMPYYNKEFLKAAKSYREDLLVLPCRKDY